MFIQCAYVGGRVFAHSFKRTATQRFQMSRQWRVLVEDSGVTDEFVAGDFGA